nr:transcription factor FapR [Texcoconibacillus texcoconensis]
MKEKIESNPFMTDDALAEHFGVSVQTIRLDRLELNIPEVRERIKDVAQQQSVKALPLEEVIGEVIDLQLDQYALSIFDVRREHVFSRNRIARGHHLFAQANSLAVAVIDDELALTTKSNVSFKRQVVEGERVVAKANVTGTQGDRTEVQVHSYVDQELVFQGTFELYRADSEEA